MKAPPGWEIPVQIRVRLGERTGRQRAMVADDHVVMILHKVPLRRAHHHREGVYYWRSPAGEWRFSGRGQPLPMLSRLIDEYQDAVEALTEQHEQAKTANARFLVLEAVGPLNRAARNLYETLQNARHGIQDRNGRRELQTFCDKASDIARAFELLQMDAKNALDFLIAKQGEIQAVHSRELERAGHRLNTVAAIFLPLTAVASVFGMNLRNGLEQAPPWMFWLVLAGTVIAGITLSEILVNVKGGKKQRA